MVRVVRGWEAAAMRREEIIAANPIADFVGSRGHELKPAGENFVTSGCPVKQHKKHHRPNTINPAKNLWHCNDCGGGGTVIEWLAKEKRISVADAMRELGGSGEIVCAYDYTDERGKLLFQVCRFNPKDFRQRRPDGNGGFISESARRPARPVSVAGSARSENCRRRRRRERC